MNTTEFEDKYETTEPDKTPPDETQAILIYGSVVIRDVESDEVIMRQRF